MRLLRVVTSIDPVKGGVSSAVVQTISYLKKKDVSVDVLSFDSKSLSELYECDFNHIHLGRGFGYYQIKFSYLFWLFRNARNYDAVIIDGLWQFHVVGGYFLRYLNIPYFVYVHGMLDPYFNKDVLKYVKKLPFWFLVERNVLRLSNSVVFTARGELEKAVESFPFSRFSSSICTLGFSDPLDCIRSVNVSVSDDCYLYMSRIHPKKGIPVLLESLSQLTGSESFFLDIYGEGDSSYVDYISRLILKYKLAECVRMRGGVYGDKKWHVLSSYELFILPSHQENFGIVVAEALSVGLPVLITNKIDIYTTILEYSAGIVVDDSVEGLRKGLEIWRAYTYEEKQVIRNNARRCFLQCFTEDIAGQDMLGLVGLK